MKRLLTILLVLVMVAALTACAGTPAAESPAAEAPAAEAPAAEAPAAEPAAEEPAAEAPAEEAPAEITSTQVVVSHWGGTLGEAFRECYFNDFEADTGIKVVEVEATNNKSRLKAMVDTGSVDTDLMQGSELEIFAFKDIGYLEAIDYDSMDPEIVANLTDAASNEFGVGSFSYASIIAYRTDVFTEENHPTSWADFWDLEKFPGKRTMVSGASGDYPPLEYALLADGVAVEDLYPLDVERAFASLEKLEPEILKWWMTGAEAPQMLIDEEVVMAEAFSGRITALINQGVPVAIEWNEGRMNFDFWLMPKNPPNKEAAHLLLNYCNDPERQAKFAEMTGYAPSNSKAYDYIPADIAAGLATSETNLQKVFPVNNEYWAEHQTPIVDQWMEWEAAER